MLKPIHTMAKKRMLALILVGLVVGVAAGDDEELRKWQLNAYIDQLERTSADYFELASGVNATDAYYRFLDTFAKFNLPISDRHSQRIREAQIMYFALLEASPCIDDCEQFLDVREDIAPGNKDIALTNRAVRLIFDTVMEADLADGYSYFLNRFPDENECVLTITRRLAQCAMRLAESDGSSQAYEQFIIEYPFAPKDLRADAMERCISLKIREMRQVVAQSPDEKAKLADQLFREVLSADTVSFEAEQKVREAKKAITKVRFENERQRVEEELAVNVENSRRAGIRFLVKYDTLTRNDSVFAGTQTARDMLALRKVLERVDKLREDIDALELSMQDMRDTVLAELGTTGDKLSSIQEVIKKQNEELRKITEFPWDPQLPPWENVKTNGKQALRIVSEATLESLVGAVIPGK